MSETEFSQFARDPQSPSRRRALVPVIVAGILSIPLLGIGVVFSLYAFDVVGYIIQMGASGFQEVLMFLLMTSGFISILGTGLLLFIALRRPTLKWRLWFSGAALAVAAAMPLYFLVLLLTA